MNDPLTLEQLKKVPHGKIKESTLKNICDRANKIVYLPAHINRDAWKPCDECKPSCKICANYNAWDRYGKPQVCDTCEDYSNFKPDDKYCADCGRPMTEEAWKELEKRVRIQNDENH